MDEMPYRGVVRGNTVILEEGARLPEGAPVVVELEKGRSRKPDFSQDPFLYPDKWLPEAPGDVPEDLAHHHDYYLYGAEKR